MNHQPVDLLTHRGPRLRPGLQEQGHHGEDPVVGDGPHRPVPGKKAVPGSRHRKKKENQHETHEKGEFQWDFNWFNQPK